MLLLKLKDMVFGALLKMIPKFTNEEKQTKRPSYRVIVLLKELIQ